MQTNVGIPPRPCGARSVGGNICCIVGLSDGGGTFLFIVTDVLSSLGKCGRLARDDEDPSMADWAMRET